MFLSKFCFAVETKRHLVLECQDHVFIVKANQIFFMKQQPTLNSTSFNPGLFLSMQLRRQKKKQ